MQKYYKCKKYFYILKYLVCICIYMVLKDLTEV